MAAGFRINLPLEKVYSALTSFYMAEVNFRGMEYIDDANTRQAIYRLAQALVSTRPRAGIMLCGSCGNGKTTLVYALRGMINALKSCGHFDFLGEYYKVGMRIYDAKELTQVYNRLEEWRGIRSSDMLAIDDLGKEPAEVMEYGNLRSPVIDLLEHRYQTQKFTLVTTNLAPGDMRSKYGERLADRFREMFEVIVFDFDSYRGKAERRQQ